MTISSGLLEIVQSLVAALLLGLAVWSVPAAWLRAGRTVRGWGRLAVGAVVLAVIAAAVLRWFVAPHRLAAIFIGYKQTSQALSLLPVSHYGVGSQALHHALFAAFPADHRTIVWANAVMGVLTVPLAGAWAGTLLRDRRAGAVAAILVALVPLFVRNDTSEANHVPCLLWAFGGLVLLQGWIATGRRLPGLAAVSLLALASISRPEMPALVATMVLVTLVSGRTPRERLRDPVAWAGVAAFLALVTPHLLHVANAVDALRRTASLPGDPVQGGLALLGRVLDLNVLVRPDLFPVGLTAAAAVALLVPGPAGRRSDLGLLVLVAAALALYVVDLDLANMARVQVPAALFTTVLAAGGLSRVAGRLGTWPGAVVGGVAVATAVPSVSTLWAPTNEATEERLVRAARAALPEEDVTLVRLHESDRRDRSGPGRFTHYHFPDYLFRPPGGSAMLRPVTSFLDSPDFAVPAYFFRGMRCYAEFRPRETPPPEGRHTHPACRAMAERFRLEPIVEWEVPNHGDVWIEYYGTAPTLTVGLYRVRPKAGDGERR
ncbi:MAG: glycosyltransferase family 39 protein [Myxococcota bacterium]